MLSRAVFDDFNQDGKIDLFVANDSDPNFLFLNQGERHFQGVRRSNAGVAVNADGEVAIQHGSGRRGLR